MFLVLERWTPVSFLLYIEIEREMCFCQSLVAAGYMKTPHNFFNSTRYGDHGARCAMRLLCCVFFPNMLEEGRTNGRL